MKKNFLAAIFICISMAVFGQVDQALSYDMELVQDNIVEIEEDSQGPPQTIAVMGRLDFDHNEYRAGGDVTLTCFNQNIICLMIEIPADGPIVLKGGQLSNSINIDDYDIEDFPGGQYVTVSTSNN